MINSSAQSLLRLSKRKILTFKNNYFDDHVFIHINKNGGTSISQALQIPQEHYTALEKRSRVGMKTWDRKAKFSVIRNPWDRIVSLYCYRLKTNQTNLSDLNISFEQWIALTLVEQHSEFFDKPKMFMPQTDWLVDEKDNIIVDHILRFEYLLEDFKDFTVKLGLTNVVLPHVNRTKRATYQSYFNAKTKHIVETFYLKDIQTFGYSYDK